MLEFNYGQVTLHCDGDCDNEGPGDLGSFQLAQDWMKRNGWKPKKVNGEWEHYCPDCLKKQEAENVNQLK